MAAPPPVTMSLLVTPASPTADTEFTVETQGVPAANYMKWAIPKTLTTVAGGGTASHSVTLKGPAGTYKVSCNATLATSTGEGGYSKDAEKEFTIS